MLLVKNCDLMLDKVGSHHSAFIITGPSPWLQTPMLLMLILSSQKSMLLIYAVASREVPLYVADNKPIYRSNSQKYSGTSFQIPYVTLENLHTIFFNVLRLNNITKLNKNL